MAHLDQFQIFQQLGKGAYSTVSLVRRRSTTHYHALKTIPKEKVNTPQQAAHVFAERAALTTLVDCPHVVTLDDTFKDNTHLYFLLECIGGGPLHHHLRAASAGRFVATTAKFYAIEMSLALEACHTHNIIYRDLKLSNVLVSKSGHLKLTDFGFAKVVPWGEKTSTYCGTPHAMAPEILLQQPHDRCCDWWSFGVLVYEMMMGAPPTGYKIGKEEQQEILLGHPNAAFPHDVFGAVDEEKSNTSQGNRGTFLAADFIRQCWSIDPATRLGGGQESGAKEIHAHAWMDENIVNAIRASTITPPVPNATCFLFEDHPDPTEEASTLTAQEQAMFAGF